jgi:hypothetical protein
LRGGWNMGISKWLGCLQPAFTGTKPQSLNP